MFAIALGLIALAVVLGLLIERAERRTGGGEWD
jgi:hypothetical protein